MPRTFVGERRAVPQGLARQDARREELQQGDEGQCMSLMFFVLISALTGWDSANELGGFRSPLVRGKLLWMLAADPRLKSLRSIANAWFQNSARLLRVCIL